MAVREMDILIKERRESIFCNHKSKHDNFQCDKESVSGTVSQRACVYCGARVVLNPITDAYHIVHGPIGCASYTWDIRGSLSSGEEVYRNSFSTDLREIDVIFGGEKKLAAAIDEIYTKFKPPVIFVYCTCIVGVIGDDVEEVCRKAEKRYGIRVIPVKSPGFAGHKSMGYKAACNALIDLMGELKDRDASVNSKKTINYLGDFNMSGEVWILKNYLEQMGVEIVSTITGDAKCEDLKKAPKAALNVVQCAGSMTYLAKRMEEKYGIPFMKISFFGVEDTKLSLLNIANFFNDEKMVEKAEKLIFDNEGMVNSELEYYRARLKGKKAAIYVGGGFKAISLIKQFRDLGIDTVVVGTQTGKKEDYDVIREITEEGTIILDDANPYELEKFMKEKGADILVGGVKERPLAYKLGVAFCDHNHERKHPLCGFIGAVNFAKEVDYSINSNVWNIIKRERGGHYGKELCEYECESM
ncbi:nitrogenase iron-molybdenum cofactor biosynthesis protein NifE [Clostridium oryzae]|uniref:Nitrogenase iron-molybdenum cofactor biosynthesis protein NifE n=1 Tax=Clostridium oryzae TaxID=1450648 RepID=A0A1V4IPD0_9CLOT|nr:nitrogenase iron-molybdenum cofactor biosynthesis protein NifE [Clostridium oryzae]OPJ61911.1 nitrogenase molybdenum-iron protein alpha chain [Clostridium oryzae]